MRVDVLLHIKCHFNGVFVYACHWYSDWTAVAVLVVMAVFLSFLADFELSNEKRKIRVQKHWWSWAGIFDCCLKANISRPSIQMPTSFNLNVDDDNDERSECWKINTSGWLLSLLLLLYFYKSNQVLQYKLNCLQSISLSFPKTIQLTVEIFVFLGIKLHGSNRLNITVNVFTFWTSCDGACIISNLADEIC